MMARTFSHSTTSSKTTHMTSMFLNFKLLHTRGLNSSSRSSSASPSLSTVGFSATVSKGFHSSTSVPPSIPLFQPCMDRIPSAVTMVPPRAPMSPTKPVPPPATQPRKQNPSASQTVVYPPKDSCSKYVLLIMSSTPPQFFFYQSCHHDSQHTRGRHQVSRRDTGPRHRRPCLCECNGWRTSLTI